MSPDAGKTSGNHFDMVGALVRKATVTPARRARASNEAMAGTILPVQFGWREQMGSTMSNMSNAVFAGSSTTGTGSGGDGICSVREGLVMGNSRLQRSRRAHRYRPLLRQGEKRRGCQAQAFRPA